MITGSRQRRWPRGQVSAIIIMPLALMLAALTACGREEATGGATPSQDPAYYVEGATPSPGLNEGVPLPDSEYEAGCVPWSRDREDVLVCGPISESFEPPLPPGGYEDYPAVCDAAATAIAEEGSDLMAAKGLSTAPEVDVGSCGAAGLGSAQEARWVVKFGLSNPDSVAPYASVVIQDFTITGDEHSFVVILSETPWPLA